MTRTLLATFLSDIMDSGHIFVPVLVHLDRVLIFHMAIMEMDTMDIMEMDTMDIME